MTLGEVAEWGSGGTPKRTELRYFGGSIPWLVIGDLNDGTVSASTTQITEEGLRASAAKWIPQGAVLLAMYGSIGKLGIAGIPLTTNQAIAHAIVRDEVVESRYLFWYLRSIRRHLKAAGKGGTQQNISQTVIKALPIPIPPRDIQHQIVDFVEGQISRVDDVMHLLTSARRKLGAYAGSVLAAACHGRLRESASAQSDWRVTRYGELVERVTSGSRAWRRFLGRGEGRFVLAQHVTDGRVEIALAPSIDAPSGAEADRTRICKNDILVTVVGDVGRAALVRDDPSKAFVSQSVALTRPTDSGDARYLEIYLRSPDHGGRYFREKQYGVGRGHLLLSHLKDLPVALPPATERDEIANDVDAKLSVLGAVDQEVDAAMQRTGRLREEILRRAFDERFGPGSERQLDEDR